MIKPYEKYKNSGIQWIGEIPEHWNIIKMKRLSPVKRGASPRPIDDLKYFDEDGEFSWVRISDLTASERYLLTTTEKLSELGASFSVKRYPGDFFLSIAGSVGKPIISKIKCCIHDGFVWFPDLKINPEYLYYLFQSGLPFGGLGKLGTQLNLNTETIGNIYIPDLSNQDIDKIIQYLDYQTGIIDELISQKEKLIELLKEKRQAVINEAVTKGLNPDAKMKDSGIEWLGELPEEWEVVRLRFLGKCQNGVSAGSEYFGEGDPFVNYSDVYKNAVLPSKVLGLAKSTESDKENYSVLEGDIFFTRTSETVEEIGLSSVCLKSIENSVFAGFLIRFRPKNNLLFNGFSKYFFRSHIPRIHFVKEMNLVTRASLSQELLKSLPVCLPPFKVQKEIGQFLDKKVGEMDDIKISLQAAIHKLKEYRQSLISEAVTGKIDVRAWQAPNQNVTA